MRLNYSVLRTWIVLRWYLLLRLLNPFHSPVLQVKVLDECFQLPVVLRRDVPGGFQEVHAVFLDRFPRRTQFVTDEPVGDVDVSVQVLGCCVLLQDRYVIGNVRLPEYIGDQTGTITVNISVDKWGHVKKTSIAPGADITDEEVIESVRRAALKTDFNSNSDARETSKGTISYTFKKMRL